MPSKCKCAKIKCVAFDVDGVLVDFESSWWRVHEALGTTKLAKLHHELYRRGVIGYWEWMYLDTLLWIEAKPGITIWDIDSMLSCRVSDDVKSLVRELKARGLRVILVSGGIDVLVSRVASMLGVDAWEAPRLAFDPWGKLVPGGYSSVIAGVKSKALKKLLSRFNISPQETVFVGDSLWDVDAMRMCCYSIAFRPKDRNVVEEACTVVSSFNDLRRVLLSLVRG